MINSLSLLKKAEQKYTKQYHEVPK